MHSISNFLGNVFSWNSRAEELTAGVSQRWAALRLDEVHMLLSDPALAQCLDMAASIDPRGAEGGSLPRVAHWLMGIDAHTPPTVRGQTLPNVEPRTRTLLYSLLRSNRYGRAEASEKVLAKLQQLSNGLNEHRKKLVSDGDLNLMFKGHLGDLPVEQEGILRQRLQCARDGAASSRAER